MKKYSNFVIKRNIIKPLQFNETMTQYRVYQKNGNRTLEKCKITNGSLWKSLSREHYNNTGILCGAPSPIRDKCECLAHFSYQHSNSELLIVDMQGSEYSLFDPEIASKNLQDGDEMLFSTGNLSTMAINNFLENHHCNEFCNLLGLNKLRVTKHYALIHHLV